MDSKLKLLIIFNERYTLEDSIFYWPKIKEPANENLEKYVSLQTITYSVEEYDQLEDKYQYDIILVHPGLGDQLKD